MIATAASAVRPYQAVLRVRFQLLLQYRAAAIAGFITQCWWGAIKVMVLAAFFRETVATPMTLSQAIDYTWLGQALLTLLPWSVDPEIARMVRSGDVAYERLRPLDAYTYWYARAVARRTATPMLRAIPMVITAGFILPMVGMSAWGLSAPASSESLALFVVSMVLVIALSSAVATLMEVLTVATLSDRGVNTLIGPLIVILSGSLVPLPLYPEWLQPALRLQPFAGLLDTPLRIYTGHLGTTAALAGLVRQAVWIVVLVGIGRVLMARVMARLQAQGG
jgi:ABC-2 type transport system permease protein